MCSIVISGVAGTSCFGRDILLYKHRIFEADGIEAVTRAVDQAERTKPLSVSTDNHYKARNRSQSTTALMERPTRGRLFPSRLAGPTSVRDEG